MSGYRVDSGHVHGNACRMFGQPEHKFGFGY